MQQSGSGRWMCDICSCLSSIISSAGFRGKEISLSQRTHALYCYKNMDKTSFFLISFQSLKKEKCTQCIFSPSEQQNVWAERSFGVNRVQGLNKNVFLECQLMWVTFPLCPEKFFYGKGLESSNLCPWILFYPGHGWNHGSSWFPWYWREIEKPETIRRRGAGGWSRCTAV